MEISQLVECARAFESFLRQFEPAISIRPILAESPFLDVYQEELPVGGGVYVIRTRERIVYIGKARHFGRIWGHTGIPKNGKFADCRFITDDTLNRIDEASETALRDGQFFIDFLLTTPEEFCSCVETFLQSVYWSSAGEHPVGNRRIG
jgi:hypothetical protein